jgi:hypothetical protein
MTVDEKPKCAAGCGRSVAETGGRCNRHDLKRLTKKTIKYGGESREKIMRVPFGTNFDDPRTTLVEALAAAVGSDHANTVIDALDEYLATDPTDRTPALQWSAPNPHVELDKTIRERDEAVARAEMAEQALAKVKKSRRSTKRARKASLDAEARPA